MYWCHFPNCQIWNNVLYLSPNSHLYNLVSLKHQKTIFVFFFLDPQLHWIIFDFCLELGNLELGNKVILCFPVPKDKKVITAGQKKKSARTDDGNVNRCFFHMSFHSQTEFKRGEKPQKLEQHLDFFIIITHQLQTFKMYTWSCLNSLLYY